MAIALACSHHLAAAEIYSNGLGGGMWSNPASWRGSKVPTAEDDVTIARGDTITFDGTDDEKTAANKLFIDPNGTLAFKSAAGRVTLILGDALETYGKIQMDAARVHGDVMELRMVGKALEQRAITLMRGGSIILAGRRFLQPDQASAIISSRPENQPFTHTSGHLTITTQGQSAIDLRNALFMAVDLTARNIDNTNAFVGQRLNIVGNTFLGRCAVNLHGCDTPIVADNTFLNEQERQADIACIYITGTPLPTVRNNVIKARVRDGIMGTSLVDPLIQGNVIEKAARGMILQFCNNAMVQENRFIDCDTGFYIRLRSGVVRNNVVDDCRLPFHAVVSNHQMMSNAILNPVADKPYLANNGSKVVLFNTPIALEKLAPRQGGGRELMIAHQPMIVHVKGDLPPGAVVEVTPVGDDLEMSAEHPPVVNSPAPLDSQGLTPVMATHRALMVRTWVVRQAEGQDVRTPAPTYRVRVLAPGKTSDPADLRELASQTVKPSDSWYRADLSDATPSVEITLP